MKKTVLMLAVSTMLMTACGSSSSETTTDSVTVTGNGVDSSITLPALTDSAKFADSVGSATTDNTAQIPVH